MIGLRIDFTAGRFHATPWNRSVNDGEVEWPPAPWRILRAIVSGWYRDPVGDRATLSRLCDALAAPPRFLLPPATVGHTRHYMPQGHVKAERTVTALVLDSYVRFDRADTASAFVVWELASLDDEMHRVLDAACAQIPYLGRAESWCRIETIDAEPIASRHVRVDLSSRTLTGGPTVQRLGIDAGTRGNGLLRSLCETTDDMRKSRRRLPVGSTWLDYGFPPRFGFAPAPWTRATQLHPCPPRLERFALEAIEPRGLLPSVLDTVLVADLVHKAAIRKWSDIHAGHPAPAVFTGREGDGPARGHGHAYFLPRDLDDDGRIDHIDVRLPVGAFPNDIRALRSVTHLFAPRLESRYALTNLGAQEFDCATRWRSITPFVPPLHVKKKLARDGMDALAAWARDQAQHELRNHGYDEAVEIDVTDERPPTLVHRGGNRTRFDSFRQQRKPIGDRSRSYALRLTFAEAQAGPISIGREAHYGMGQFRVDA